MEKEIKAMNEILNQDDLKVVAVKMSASLGKSEKFGGKIIVNPISEHDKIKQSSFEIYKKYN